ncbi:diguanylate cyclase [Petroclostridium sp. X23]|uniref:diguanylate cyclase n=1 Tax=Petroclostridium sp. X23 TaxID=3045146 RepID=UPI0024ADDA5A|nr:diguanylate cyclase [Petroclostridium sp. X23]WHH58192.1 diguanylate cyclase [Petroclostridium sp. X23]
MNIKGMLSTWNTLAFKVRVSLLFIAIVPLGIYLVINNWLLSHHLLELENKNIISKTHQAHRVLDAKASELSKLSMDYGIWTDLHEKVINPDLPWIKENITTWIPENFGMDLVVIANKNLDIINAFGTPHKKLDQLLEKEIIEHVFTNIDNIPDNGALSGFKIFQNELYLISLCPILRNDYSGPYGGMVVIGKKITPAFLEEISYQYGYEMFMYDSAHIVSSRFNQTKAQRALSLFKQTNENVLHMDKATIFGVDAINDISGVPSGYLFIMEPRELNIILKNNLIAILGCIIIILLLTIRIKRSIVNPIKDLQLQISKMGKENTLSYVNIKGTSEIVSLADSFNKMIDNLHRHRLENENLRTLSITDDLTSLYNHRFFYEYFDRLTSNGCKNICILFCDIDHFKSVNDHNGHVIGDILLREVGRIIKAIVGHKAVFRYGGEEFVIVLDDYFVDSAYKKAEIIRLAVNNSSLIQKYSSYLPITISIGIAAYPSDASDIDMLIDKADTAMYFAKQNGRNQCHIYRPFMSKSFKSVRYAKKRIEV